MAPPQVAELLASTQRLKTAGELNAAILESQHQSQEPKLLQLLQMLVFGQSVLGPEGPGQITFPPLDLSSTVDEQEELAAAAEADPGTIARIAGTPGSSGTASTATRLPNAPRYPPPPVERPAVEIPALRHLGDLWA